MLKSDVFFRSALMVLLIVIVSGAAMGAAPTTLTQNVSYGGETITLRMTKESVRGDHFEVLVQNSSGGYDTWTAGEVRTYVGTVDEYPGAFVAGIRKSNNVLKARVYFDRGATWYTYGSSVTGTRGTGAESFKMPSKPSVTPGKWGTDTYKFDVGFDCDYRYYDRMNSVDACFEMVEFSTVCLKVQYLQDALLMPAIGRVIIRTSRQHCPYYNYSGTGILNPFRTEWNTNQSDAERDVAACVTPNIGGGVAWLGVIGTSSAYSVNGISSDGSFDVVWRHELGHNWSVYDYHANSPEGPTINCGNQYGRFNGPAVESIFNHRDSRLSIFENVGTYNTIDFGPYAALDFVSQATAGESVAIDVMANDFDVNAQSISLDSFDSTSSKGGTVTLSAGTGGDGRDELVYTAPANAFNEVDYFYYTVKDSAGNYGTGVALVYVDLANTLKGYYPLDETSGTVAGDLSRFGNDGTLAGGASFSNASVAGKFGTALELDGTDDCIELDGLNLNSDKVTITAWVKPSSTPNDWSGIVFNRTQDAAGLNFASGGELRYHWDGGNWSWSSGLVPPVGQWSFVALVVEPTKATIYMNTGGSTQTATHYGAHGSQAFAGTTYVGRDSNHSTRYFNGAMDDIRIFNYAIDADGIEGIIKGIKATAPVPVDGATDITSPLLNWITSIDGATYDVYVGTSPTAVENATTSSPEYRGSVAGKIFDASAVLSAGTTYYWRVDSVLDGETVKGDVWDFSTGSNLTLLTDGLKLHYTMDNADASGSTVYDVSDAGNNGTISGATKGISGQIEEGFRFDGYNDRVYGARLNLNSNTVTMSAWIKRHGNQPDYGGIMICVDSNNKSGLNFAGNNELCYHWTGGYWGWRSGLVVPDNQWSHIALVVEPDKATLYVNGQSAVSSGSHAVEEFSDYLDLGTYDGWSSRMYEGDMDDAAVWNRSLSREEILYIYQQGVDGSTFDEVQSDVTAPAAPVDVAAAADDSSVSLDWSDNSEEDLAGYNVYRSEVSGSGYSQLTSGTIFSAFGDGTAVNGTTYYYVVTAVDQVGNESVYSDEMTALPHMRGDIDVDGNVNFRDIALLSEFWLDTDCSDSTPCGNADVDFDNDVDIDDLKELAANWLR
ncbi:Alpha-amylase/pullulanase [Anaerohalosphaera lusitana]|uniref:Alpha-amylase/pullulanase n=1 Tax=Anaerohalosphaera lusitana TaxID=1936003 RepID=A0A1U9NGR3_9BACT|nr:LamG-like jellyroll fold domain-containing protein [Anaerohalosphaera lusitana]AQT67119.1 Alpha-amylase/pullulanase [Anaerohalosphaera lusitana]